ncbi:ComF family protein [Streptomyces sp. NPDC059985]|uniref:ComF family protein n=1 Tax=Streptomyces sp. NPDC059985 TaxID=3347025 RepID=UPI0036BD45F5
MYNGSPAVCSECAARSMRPLAEHHCVICSQSLSVAGANCRNPICNWTQLQRSFTRVGAVALFAAPLTNPVKAFKYDQGKAGWAVIFGRLIVGWMNNHAEEMAGIDLVIGNPSAADRKPLQHIEAIMVAAHAEDTTGRWPITTPDSPVLVKLQETPKSAGEGARWSAKMDAARAHAAALELQQSVRGKRILLVDDVFTTGATFHTVGKLLTEAGAAEVRGLVLARVPFAGS